MQETFIGYANELGDGDRKIVAVDGDEVVVLRHNGAFYAFANHCVHMGGPVGEGVIMPKVEARLTEGQQFLGEQFSECEFHLVCPWHGWEYDVETGECAADRRIALKRYQVVERANALYLSDN